MAALAVAGRVVDGHALDVHVVALHRNRLHRRVLDVQVLDVRALQLVRVHELGLGLAAVRALAVPPALTLGVDHGARGSSESDALTAEADEGALPLLVAEGGGALEGDLSHSQ